MGAEWVDDKPEPRKPRKTKEQLAAERAKKRTKQDKGLIARLSRRLR